MTDYLHFFNLIYQAQDTLKMINVYRGVPVSFPGTVLGFPTNQTVRFQTHPTQILCMRVQGHTFMQNPRLPSILKGTVLSTDIKANTAIVGKFETASESIGQRAFVRVSPKTTTYINVLSEQMASAGIHPFRAELVEISLHGIGLNLNVDLFDLGLIRKDKQIEMQFTLPDEAFNEKHEVSLTGIVRNVDRLNARHTVRLGVQSFPDKFAESFLSRYIASRQNDVLQEIRKANEMDFIMGRQ